MSRRTDWASKVRDLPDEELLATAEVCCRHSRRHWTAELEDRNWAYEQASMCFEELRQRGLGEDVLAIVMKVRLQEAAEKAARTGVRG